MCNCEAGRRLDPQPCDGCERVTRDTFVGGVRGLRFELTVTRVHALRHVPTAKLCGSHGVAQMFLSISRPDPVNRLYRRLTGKCAARGCPHDAYGNRLWTSIPWLDWGDP